MKRLEKYGLLTVMVACTAMIGQVIQGEHASVFTLIMFFIGAVMFVFGGDEEANSDRTTG